MVYKIKNIMNGKKWAVCIIVLVLALAAVLFIRFGSNSEEEPQSVAEAPEEQDKVQENKESRQEAAPEELSVISPVITEEMPCGADGPILDYADDHLFIFHDYFGLFAYDLVEKR